MLWFHLYEVPRLVKFIQTESRVVSGSWGKERIESYCFMGSEFQFFKVKKVLDGGNVSTTMWMDIILLNCALKRDEHGKCYYAYFITIKIKTNAKSIYGSLSGGGARVHSVTSQTWQSLTMATLQHIIGCPGPYDLAAPISSASLLET